ncbi:hypothetical protein N072000002_10140 [Clostridium tetani]|uniref:Uncharacterized protein n=1 Tax=Clostridium tetani TaxID=1513 RepID=A0ABC8EAW4_CLOTA|nr:hypothetical protein [Clostridium tetani]BDR80758.1 hypothetical protein K234311028_10040 [Clostridium tetani]BDR89213.1 hypothetical protein N072000002_10140 [Clostridium tetani]
MKNVNYYLWKLGLYESKIISKKEIDKNNLPKDVFYSLLFNEYNQVTVKEIDPEELDKFVKAKNAYNLNIIRICIVICTIFLGILVFINSK